MSPATEFKRRLLLSERSNERKETIHNLIHAFVLASQDVFRKIYAIEANPRSAASLSECMCEFGMLFDFYAEGIDKIKKRFNNCSMPIFDASTGMISYK